MTRINGLRPDLAIIPEWIRPDSRVSTWAAATAR